MIMDSKQVWTQMKGGRLLDIANLQPDDIDFREIADVLANQMRFAGHFEKPISVAQHTLIVFDAAREMGNDGASVPYALLHDCHEAFIGDITTPAHQLIRALCFDDPIECVKNRLDVPIYHAAGLQLPTRAMRAFVKIHDTRALETERRDFLSRPLSPWPGDPSPCKPLKKIYRLRPAHDVADELFARFQQWLPVFAGAKSHEAA